jgi:transcriptional regulator with XRE-family HTH domain|nr:MAG TPA: helix-turn-helix domain protein [Caudoviricetes sp.]
MRKEIEVIKKHRKKIGLTQAELADKAGIGRSTLAQYEAGDRNPKRDALEKIAQALDMTPAEFFNEVYDEGEDESKMPEEIKTLDKWDGELKIYNLEDRLAVSTILIKNGYDVGQHQRKKDPNSKALDYFLHFTAADGNTASK